jgi:hypothetical protein
LSELKHIFEVKISSSDFCNFSKAWTNAMTVMGRYFYGPASSTPPKLDTCPMDLSCLKQQQNINDFKE